MKKFCGHVLQPLMEEAQRELGKKAPPGWSVRSKAVPEYKGVMKGIGEDLGKLDERVRSKLDKRHGSAAGWKEKGPKLSSEFEEEGMKNPWETYVRRLEGAWTAADIKTLKKRWAHLVVSPVDKLTTDGLLL